MSTTLGTDLIAVERSGTVYKETKTDWDTAVSAGGSSSTNGIVIKMYWCMNTVGYNASGRHRYGTGGTMYSSRSDTSGCYTRSSSTSQNSGPYQRPNTKVKVDGTWYSIGTIGTSIGGSSLLRWILLQVQPAGRSKGFHFRATPLRVVVITLSLILEYL